MLPYGNFSFVSICLVAGMATVMLCNFFCQEKEGDKKVPCERVSFGVVIWEKFWYNVSYMRRNSYEERETVCPDTCVVSGDSLL